MTVKRHSHSAEKVVHHSFILKMTLNFRDWKIRGFEAFSLINICQPFGINHLQDGSLDSHGRRKLSAGHDWKFISSSH
jgi:hypothetical protein